MKTADEAKKTVLSYERGDKYAESYVSTTTGGGISSAPSEVELRSSRNQLELSESDIKTLFNGEGDRTLNADF